MRILAHIASMLILLALFAGIPFALFGNVSKVAALAQGSTDAVSAATVIQEAPSGHFVVLINRNLHTDPEVLGNWELFLSGRDAPLIMEDVVCMAANGDAAGIDLAAQLASRLPANQMQVRTEDAVLALSKAENGVFDILVLSDEMAQAMDASTLYDLPFVDVITR